MTLNNIYMWLNIGAIAFGGLIGVWGVWRRIDKHQHDSTLRSQRLEDRFDHLEKQFGPNGGGMREAINRISDTIGRMDSKLDGLGREVSRLQGEFNQHIVKNND